MRRTRRKNFVLGVRVVFAVLAAVASVATIAMCARGEQSGMQAGGDVAVTEVGSVGAEENVVITNANDVNGDVIVYNVSATGAPDLSCSNALYEQGREFFRQADYGSAIECYTQALEEHRALHHADADMARIYCALGISHRRMGCQEESIDDFTRSIGTYESVLGDKAGSSVSDANQDGEGADDVLYEKGYAYYQRCVSYVESGNLDRAASDYDQCGDIMIEYGMNGGNRTDLYTLSSMYNLEGRIAASAAFDADYQFPSAGEGEYESELDKAYEAYNAALQMKWLDVVDYDTSLDEDTVVSGCLFGRRALAYEIETDEGRIPLGAVKWQVAGSDAETAAILANRAMVEHVWGWNGEAINDCRASIALYNSLPEEERAGMYDACWIYSCSKLAMAANEGSEVPPEIFTEMVDTMRLAADYSVKWLGTCPLTAVSLETCGALLLLVEDYDSAISKLEKARDMFAELGMQDDVEKEEKLLADARYIAEDGGGQWEVRSYRHLDERDGSSA